MAGFVLYVEMMRMRMRMLGLYYILSKGRGLEIDPNQKSLHIDDHDDHNHDDDNDNHYVKSSLMTVIIIIIIATRC